MNNSFQDSILPTTFEIDPNEYLKTRSRRDSEEDQEKFRLEYLKQFSVHKLPTNENLQSEEASNPIEEKIDPKYVTETLVVYAYSNCKKCGVQLEYPSEAIFVVCNSCGSKLNPHDYTKVNCLFCGKLFYKQSIWDKFQCPICNKIMFKGDFDPHRSKELRDKEIEISRVITRRKSDSGIKLIPNPYMLFCKLKRDELKQEYPNLSFSEIGALLGKIWNGLSKKEKMEYKNIYEKQKADNMEQRILAN